MSVNERVEAVIMRAETLVGQLEATVGELVQLLREYNEKEKESDHV